MWYNFRLSPYSRFLNIFLQGTPKVLPAKNLILYVYQLEGFPNKVSSINSDQKFTWATYPQISNLVRNFVFHPELLKIQR
jgi:hypothetical protein